MADAHEIDETDRSQHVFGHTFGEKLCEALGLDTSGIKKVVITACPGDLVTVDIERFYTGHDADKTYTLIRKEKFKLVKSED